MSNERIVPFESALALLRLGYAVRRRAWRGTPWNDWALHIRQPADRSLAPYGVAPYVRLQRCDAKSVTLPWNSAPEDVLATDWELSPHREAAR